MDFLKKEVGADQLVGQAELLPAIGALHEWPGRFYQRYVIHFVDNESAKFGPISGYSPSRASALILGEYWKPTANLLAIPWFDRVPSPSNPSDGPSRLAFEGQCGLTTSMPRRIEQPRFLKSLIANGRQALESGD